MLPATSGAPGFVEDVEIQGHIIDSLLLPKILDEILTRGGSYVLKDIRIGQRQSDPSRPHRGACRRPRAQGHPRPDPRSWCRSHYRPRLHAVAADMDGAFPEGFYSTTNYRTQVRLHGEWIEVEDQEMDCGMLVDPEGTAARCMPMTDVRKGDRIVVGRQGLRVFPAEWRPAEPVRVHGEPRLQRETQGRNRPRDRTGHEAHPRSGEKILAVLGPAVVHTGSVGMSAR